MIQDRRSVLTALGLALPLGLGGRPWASSAAPGLRLRSFEDAVREAFRAGGPEEECPCRRVEVGHSEAVQGGLQGCYNDRPFAGFPAGWLRIVRTGFGPGPSVGGVRLYVATVDVALVGDDAQFVLGRPLDFASLPPPPTLSYGPPDATGGGEGKSNRRPRVARDGSPR